MLGAMKLKVILNYNMTTISQKNNKDLTTDVKLECQFCHKSILGNRYRKITCKDCRGLYFKTSVRCVQLKYGKQQIESLYRQWLNGQSYNQLGQSLCVSRQTIRNLFEAFGFTAHSALKRKLIECRRCQKGFEVPPTSNKKFCCRTCQVGWSKYTPETLKKRNHDRFVKRYYGNPKFRKQIIETSKRYQKQHPEQVREWIKRYYIKLRKDPIRYQQWLMKQRQNYYKRIRTDRDRKANSRRTRKYYWKRKLLTHQHLH